ncbi:LTA synthase family protein [uncultured Eudoraea sp.]|uniref:LTA synthase family protein n=1 Tax=uncultured Eudoraea sp. TaxID=1035614 RepID=UPI002639D64E|nr:LTA synthase family protein [uncultured Eudoraea sp.]
MQQLSKTSGNNRRMTLRDFIRLIMAFFLCLVVLSFYQNIRLYIAGVIDGIFTKSLLLLIIHHIGFTSLIGLFIAFVFNFIEGKKAGLGLKVTALLFFCILIIEGLLIEFYISNYEILGAGFLEVYNSRTTLSALMFSLLLLIPGMAGLFILFYKVTVKIYGTISRMYPFTIVLFSLFLATLTSDKKPVNENKLQYLAYSIADDVFDFNKYEGEEEYPLLHTYVSDKSLVPYFNLGDEKPNLVFIVVEGLGSDFVGDRSNYRGFTPFLDSLQEKSLYWTNYLSNAGESYAALPCILGSLPFGENGFTNSSDSPARQTIYGILKKSNYTTSFNYGGNSALNHLDKFLYEERVDFLLDNKGFGRTYKKQEEDAAGISLGYPDKELYKKWQKDHFSSNKPRLDVFFTLSSKKPFLIPQKEAYLLQVDKILSQEKMAARPSKLVRKNKEVFASILYADSALKSFFSSYAKNSDYANTIFIITGSHNLTDLPMEDNLGRYRVPLLIYSPLLKEPSKITSLASHLDVVPSILGLLESRYEVTIPTEVAWLGKGLIHEGVFDSTKKIPLMRHNSNIQDFVKGSHFLSGGDLYNLDSELNLTDSDASFVKQKVKENHKYFKAVNKYVINNDKIIPASLTLFAQLKSDPSKQEMVWINSVFNGSDYDNAYDTARELAFKGDTKRALLLSGYILSQVPGHADTEILMGRIHAWEGRYDIAIDILEGAIQKYPIYADGYAALLDVFFWSDNNQSALSLQRIIERNNIQNKELQNKISRSLKRIEEKKELETANKV